MQTLLIAPTSSPSIAILLGRLRFPERQRCVATGRFGAAAMHAYFASPAELLATSDN